MNRIFTDTKHMQSILELTADTMLLVSKEGLCIDISTHSDLWFLQEDYLFGKNVIEMLPERTRREIVPDLLRVFDTQTKFIRNYSLPTSRGQYYFKCLMYPYGDMVLCQYRDITERSNVKRQLEIANRKLNEAQKAALIGQWSFNNNTQLIFFSGYTSVLSREDLQSITLEQYIEYVVPEYKNLVYDFLMRNEETDLNTSIEYCMHLQGKVFYMRLKAHTRTREKDRSYTIEGYIQNVSDMQRQRNLINSLTSAINNANENISATKEDGTMIFANHTFRANYGIPENADVTQYKVYDLVGDVQSLDDWKKRCANINREGGSLEFIAPAPIRGNKDILAFRGLLHSVMDDEGETSYWSFTHNISDQIRREGKIKQLNNLLDAIMNHMPASIVVKDIEDNFNHIYQNREAYNRFNLIDKSDAIGKNDFELHSPETARLIHMEDTHIANTGEVFHRIFEDRDASGQRIVVDKVKMKIESEGFSPLILSIDWDITEVEEMRHQLELAKTKAETSDKLKSAFLANMSHEIRTPLNAIVGFSRIIMECDDPQQRRNYYSVVEANNERLLQLINEILDLSKIESGIVEFTINKVKLNELCDDVYNAHVFRCPPKVKLVYEPSDVWLTTRTDKNRVFQVISNLIGNALKFTSDGQISFGFREDGGRILFHVTDTGAGIAPDKVGRVFERFVKANNYVQGTGLGLSICKTIIERLGGEIGVTSVLGEGTSFYFTLPLQGIAETEETPTNSQTSNATASKDEAAQPSRMIRKKPNDISILVAEDTDSNFELLNAIIGRKYKLIRATDGIEAVTMFEEIVPDLILMDIKMPNLDGLEATKIIREISPDVPIIAQSAYAYEQDQRAAREAGCNDFIAKPIMIDALNKILSKWLPI